MRRAVVCLIVTSLMLVAPRALAGAQARFSPEPQQQVETTAGAANADEAAGVDQPVDQPNEIPAAESALDAQPVADLDDAAYDDPERATAAANRHQLTWFLADLDRTITQFEPQDSPHEDRGLRQAAASVRQMSDSDVNALHSALMPFMTSWTLADGPPVLARDPVATAPFSVSETADLEELRSKLLAYYDRFLPLTDIGSSADPNFSQRLAILRAGAEGLTLEELAQFDEVMAFVPTAESLLDVDPNAIIGSGGGSQHTESDGPTVPGAAVPAGATIQDHIHPGCKDSIFGPIVTAVLVAVANAAGDFIGFWSDDFMVGALATTNIPNIAKIVNIIIHWPLAILAQIASTDQTLYMNCNEFLHQTLMEKHDGEMLELTDLISGTLTAIDLDQNARFDRVDEFHVRYRESLIRLAIEEDLLRKGDKRLSLFQLPESLCITTDEHEVCGMLETAHDIVEETIQTARNLGLNADTAEEHFQDGELQESQGFYKEAYSRYREAYVLAVRANP